VSQALSRLSHEQPIFKRQFQPVLLAQWLLVSTVPNFVAGYCLSIHLVRCEKQDKIGRIASGEDAKIITNDAVNDPRIHDTEWALELGLVSFAGYPITSPEGKNLGVMALFSREKISSQEDALLESLAGTVSQVIRTDQIERHLREREALYRTLFENAGDAIHVTNDRDEILEVNDRMCELTGYTREELLSMTIADLQAPEVRAEPGSIVKNEVDQYEGSAFESLNIHKDGTIFPVEVSVSRANRASGDLYYCNLRDISKRVRAREALQDEEARFRTLFTESPIVLWEEDFSGVKKFLDGLRAEGIKDWRKYFNENTASVEECLQRVKILNVNLAALDFYQAGSVSELIASLKNLFTSESLAVFREEISSLAEGQTFFESEVETVSLTGKPLFALMRVSIPKSYHDTWEKVFVSMLDISGRIETEEIIKASEARYRSLFYDSPFEMWEQDHSDIKRYIDELSGRGVKDFRAYFEDNPNEVTKCLSMIKVVNVNQAALDKNAANNIEELSASIDQLFIDQSLDSFRDQLVVFAEGSSIYEGDVVSRTLDGKSAYSLLKVSIPSGYEDNWQRVYLSSSDITAQKQAEAILKRRADEMSALHAVTLGITTPMELEKILQSITARATELLEGSSGGLYLCDVENRKVRCVVSYKTARDFTGTTLDYGEGAAGIVAETGEPQIIDDYRTWERRASVYEAEASFQAILSVPIVWQGQIQGVLHILRTLEDRKFTQDDLDLLMILANHAAIAIENARLLQQIQQHADELEERVYDRTHELCTIVNAMAGREVRMAELKDVIKKLRRQIEAAGMTPMADDPLNLEG